MICRPVTWICCEGRRGGLPIVSEVIALCSWMAKVPEMREVLHDESLLLTSSEGLEARVPALAPGLLQEARSRKNFP